ncbi:hypothetical protein [Streptomyces jumonjinensis]|nr:hypothetical protein [Streptomyces jumonjinensis]
MIAHAKSRLDAAPRTRPAVVAAVLLDMEALLARKDVAGAFDQGREVRG